jgi:hypothetical protein
MDRGAMCVAVAVFVVIFAASAGYASATTTSSSTASSSTYVAPTFFGQELENYPALPGKCDGTGSCPTPGWGVNAILLPGNVTWCNLNPAPGQYNWAPLISWLNDPAYANADFLYVFVNPPLWANAGGGMGGCMSTSTSINNVPPSESAWKTFVSALVQEAQSCCPGKLKYFEIWNEFDSAVFWAGTVAQMVTLTHDAAQIIHGANQGLKVLSPSTTQYDGNNGVIQSTPMLQQLLTKDPASTGDIDIVDPHVYPATSNNGGSWPEGFVYPQLQRIRNNAMNPNGYGGYPLWSSEGGWGENSSSFPNYSDPASQRAFVARYYLAMLSLGVGRAYWYAYSNPSWGTLWSPSTGLTPGGIATNSVIGWLQGATLTGPCTHDSSPQILWTCTITRPGNYMGQIMWVQSGSVTITAPAGLSLLANLTNPTPSPLPSRTTIGIEPVLLEN